MKTYYLNGDQLNELIDRTDAEIIDGYDGCLLDNGLYYSNIGVFAVYEHYLNCWSSDYQVIIASSDKDTETITNDFYRNMENEEVEV